MNKKDALILLVEDEPALQFVFRAQLDRLGYRVTDIADNGLSAVEKVLANQYHVVFMDVRLPALDGISATRRIREAESEKGVHTKILGLTAFADQRRCLEAGMDDFLQKPVLLDQMDAVLTKWLQLNTPQIQTVETVKMEKYVATGERLKGIQEKLAALRRQAGLTR